MTINANRATWSIARGTTLFNWITPGCQRLFFNQTSTYLYCFLTRSVSAIDAKRKLTINILAGVLWYISAGAMSLSRFNRYELKVDFQFALENNKKLIEFGWLSEPFNQQSESPHIVDHYKQTTLWITQFHSKILLVPFFHPFHTRHSHKPRPSQRLENVDRSKRVNLCTT